jgi:hypothetical protein
MPAQFGNLIKSLATKAGLKSDDDTIKKILAIADVSTLEIPDEFNQALETNLLTEQSAAANTNVRSRLFAEALNGVDVELEKFIPDYEFDDTFKNEWKANKNTNDKIRRLQSQLKTQVDKIKEAAKTGKHDANAEAQVSALKGQITDLNKQQENLKLLHQTELDNLKNQSLVDKKNYLLQTKLAGKPLPKNGLAPEINILTAKTLLEQDLAKNNLTISFDANGQAILKQRKDGSEIDFFVDNKLVTFDGFIDGVLAQNKFVQINDSQSQQGPNKTNFQQPPPSTQHPSNASVVADIDAQLIELGVQV